MLDQIVALGISAGVFAFLFYVFTQKEEKLNEDELENFSLPALRVFFLSMAIVSILVMSWFTIGYSDSRTTTAYDENSTVIGNVTVNFTVSAPIQNVLNKYVQGNIAVLIVVLSLYVIAFVVSLLMEIVKRSKIKQGLYKNANE